jgi:Holliday junction resolvase
MRLVKRDFIHCAVVRTLRDMGLSVFDAAAVGGSFPDLVVGCKGVTYLVELKTGKAHLTLGQETFAENWRGSPVVVLRSVTEAVNWAIAIRRSTKPCLPASISTT